MKNIFKLYYNIIATEDLCVTFTDVLYTNAVLSDTPIVIILYDNMHLRLQISN
jgi:hypothetical protein